MRLVATVAVIALSIVLVAPAGRTAEVEVASVTSPTNRSGHLIRIDDLTVLDTVTGEFLESPITPATMRQSSPAGDDRGTSSLTINDGYVGCSFTDDCYPFDLDSYASGTVIDILPEGNYPYDATMNLDGTEVWIVGASGDGVVVIDRATDVVTHHIPVADYVISCVFTDDGEQALVSSRDDRTITRISTSTYAVTGTLDLGIGSGFGPGNMALDPVSGKIYAVRWYDSELYEISADGTQLLDTRTIGSNLWQLVIHPAGGYAYVTDRGTDAVLVVELSTLNVIDTLPVGDDPWGIDITDDGAYLVVACEDNHSVYVIELATSATTSILLAGDADPRDVDILNEDGYAFVPGGRVGTTSPVYVIDTASATIATSFLAPGDNTNVIAVEPQMHSGGSGAIGGAFAAPRPATLACFPNPFNPSTTIGFAVPVEGGVRLGVYDESGRLVTTLVDGHRAAGEHRISWNGRSDSGREVAGGVYFVRLDATGVHRTTKTVMLK